MTHSTKKSDESRAELRPKHILSLYLKDACERTFIPEEIALIVNEPVSNMQGWKEHVFDEYIETGYPTQTKKQIYNRIMKDICEEEMEEIDTNIDEIYKDYQTRLDIYRVRHREHAKRHPKRTLSTEAKGDTTESVDQLIGNIPNSEESDDDLHQMTQYFN